MLGERPQFSFTKQMLNVHGTGPTAFLVTAKSATPIADSVRGFYEELGQDIPVLDYIRVPRYTPFRYISNYIEKLRLRGRLADVMENVIVIDEFVYSGATLNRANQLLTDIGVENVTDIRGRWYGNAKPTEIDLDKVTSIHAAKMNFIGRQAARLAFG
jgi:hypothetical protein